MDMGYEASTIVATPIQRGPDYYTISSQNAVLLVFAFIAIALLAFLMTQCDENGNLKIKGDDAAPK